MRTLSSTLGAVTLLALLAACENDPSDPSGYRCGIGRPCPRQPENAPPASSYTVTGTWDGTWEVGGVAGTLRLALAQSGEAVTDSGTIAANGSSSAVTAAGTHRAPALSLVLESPIGERVTLTGATTATRIAAKLNGLGFDSTAVTLVKQ
jgi:hypothetical protein